MEGGAEGVVLCGARTDVRARRKKGKKGGCIRARKQAYPEQLNPPKNRNT